jgi:hypothetical protein
MQLLKAKCIHDKLLGRVEMRSWDHEGHLIQVTHDRFGYVARVDKGKPIHSSFPVVIIVFVLQKLGKL